MISTKRLLQCWYIIIVEEGIHLANLSIQRETVKRHAMTSKQKNRIFLLLLILPFFIYVLIFNYAPIFGWAYAFVDYTPGVPLSQSNFVGLKYFKLVFSRSSDFWIVLRNTLVISLLNLAAMVVPVTFAIMISHMRMPRYSRIIQTVTSIPNFISWVLVYSITFLLISSEDSALNTFLKVFRITDQPINPFIRADIAWYVQVLVALWKSTGYNAIIYLSAISSIDQELYQAADVDGANTWHKIWHVTIPGIMSTFFVLMLLAISNMLSNGFEQFWLFGNGMTWDTLEVFDTYVYRLGIKNMEYSFSTALGIFKSIVSVILLTIANVSSKKIRGESIF
jgi:putative aldouronate transport system permease protein